MAYIALARKWRPKLLTQVVGQSHVLQALTHALEQNRLHHAYLFSGTRGVGKTSIGRIFAKGLNCETGISSKPCGECSTCQEIDQGRFVDLLEIDAASRTKVEDTRELLDNVQYKPARARFKIYLIDEVHMLSRHSFNALLKTLEEPPLYVKFLLATTEPQKLPITILSRCLQFNLKPLQSKQISEQLSFILKQEKIDFQNNALNLLASAADGSMRDALSLTDQAISLGDGNINEQIVLDMLGMINVNEVLHILDALSKQNANELLNTIASIATNVVDWDQLLQQLAIQLHKIALYQISPPSLDSFELINDTQTSTHELQMIDRLSKDFTPAQIQLYYQIAIKGREELPISPNAKIATQMTLLRMLAFAPSDPCPTPINNVNLNNRQVIPQTSVMQADDLSSKLDGVNKNQKTDEFGVKKNAENEHLLEETKPLGLRHQLKMIKKNSDVTQTKTNVFSNDDVQCKNFVVSNKAIGSKLDASFTNQEHTIKSEVISKNILSANNDLLDWQDSLAMQEDHKFAIAKNCEQEKKAKNVSSLQNSDQLITERAQNYNEKLQSAKDSIIQDPNIKSLTEHFGAIVDLDTIRPL